MKPPALVLQVSDFVALCNQTLEYAYPSVCIEGELGEFRVSRGKWVYFDIKDELSSVRCFGTVYMLPGPLEDGMRVRITGTPRLHPKYNFSITISRIEAAGEGSLKRAYELLKAKLTAEGLFDEDRKRRLPSMPESVAVVASVESAAYGDFVKVMRARWPLAALRVCNVQVQGEAAAADIVAGLQYMNQHASDCEVLVLTRGGGSADDLAVFNDERVVRAVAGSRIPTVVAIGHERDFSLAELAADVRASTPSNAAELIAPDNTEQLAWLRQERRQLKHALQSVVVREKSRLADLAHQLSGAAQRLIVLERQQVVSARQLLVAYDPHAALARGYALVNRTGGGLVRSISQAPPGSKLLVRVSDGTIAATVQKTKPNQ